jgi:predicted transcriptional regulator
MTIQLPRSMEEELRRFAASRGREIGVIIEEAVRDYLEAASITDLEPAEVAEAQAALLGELGEIPEWKGGRG